MKLDPKEIEMERLPEIVRTSGQQPASRRRRTVTERRRPPGVSLPFQFLRIVGARAFISGHGPQNADASIAEPLGKAGRDLTVEQGYAAARLVGLSMLGSLQRALGDLDRIVHGQACSAW